MTATSGIQPVRTLLGRGSLYTIATTAQAASLLVVVPAVTRLLADTDGYGVVAAAQIVVQALGLVASLGLNGAITREFFEEGGADRARRLVVSTLVVATGVAAVAEVSGPWWSAVFESIDYGAELRLAVWTTVPFAVLLSAQALLRARDLPMRFVAVAALSTVGAQGAGLIALSLGDGRPAAYLAGVLGGMVVAAIVAIVSSGAVTGPASRPDLGRALRLGAPTVPHSLALLALVAADRVVVENELGLTEAGRYQLAYLIGTAAIALLLAVNNTWAPLIYAGGERRWEILADTASALQRLTPYLVGGVALGAPLWLSIVADASYAPRELSGVVAVIALTTCGYVAYLANVHILFVHRSVGFLAVASPAVAVANLAGNLVVVPRYGLVGAAWTSVVSYLVLAGAVVWRARQLERVAWDRDAIVRSWLVSALLCALAVALPHDGAWVAVRGAAAITIGVAAVSHTVAMVRSSS